MRPSLSGTTQMYDENTLTCLFCHVAVYFEGLPATEYIEHLCKYNLFTGRYSIHFLDCQSNSIYQIGLKQSSNTLHDNLLYDGQPVFLPYSISPCFQDVIYISIHLYD